MVLIDPPGSSLFNKIKRGVLYTRHEAEGKRLKNPFDTITEGIGINRITANFSKAQVRPFTPSFPIDSLSTDVIGVTHMLAEGPHSISAKSTVMIRIGFSSGQPFASRIN